MVKATINSKLLKVCILSPHPMVLEEFRRLLEESSFQLVIRQLDSMLAPDLRNLEVPRASVYVIDAHAARQATGALLGNILDHNAAARLLVVGDNLKESDSYTLLRQGVKGILNYKEAREQLPRALPLVASGGFWVPREVLSRFVDSILSTTRAHREVPRFEPAREIRRSPPRRPDLALLPAPRRRRLANQPFSSLRSCASR